MAGNQGAPFQPDSGGMVPLDASAERLAQLAVSNPELWDEIWKHPNCYDGLRQWMSERYAENQAQLDQQAQVAKEAQLAQQVRQFDDTELARSEGQPKTKRPGFALVASIAAAALVLAGTGTALAFSGTWPFSPTKDADSFAAGTGHGTGADYAGGLEHMWTVDSNELVTPSVGELGQDFSVLRAAFSRGSIALFEADYPAVTASAAIFNARGEESKLVMLDTRSGEVIFEKDLGGNTASCVADVVGDGEAFYCVSASQETSSSTLMRVEISGDLKEQSFDLVLDRVETAGDRILLAGSGGQALMLDSSGDEQWRRADLQHGSFAGIDLGADKSLIRGYDGWTLLDGAGNTLAEADSMGPYDGGNGSCDARLTQSGYLFVASEDTFCVQGDPEGDWFGFGENLFGKHFFSVGDRDYLFSETESNSELLRFPIAGSGGPLETVFETQRGAGYLGVSAGDNPVIALQGAGFVTSYALEDGAEIAQWSVAAEQQNYADQAQRLRKSLMLENVLLLGGAAYDPFTGEPLWTLESADEIQAGWMTPAGLVTLGGGCPECSTAGGAYTVSTLSLYAPAGAGGTSVSSSLSVADGPVAEAPSFIPDCPAETVLLAWMELEDGWIVVCGVDMNTPSYVAYKPVNSSKTILSLGASNPTSELAKNSVVWDAAQKRYVATLSDGSKLTLDYTIGTATIRDGETNSVVQNQHSFVRYVFVPLGGRQRGIADSAAENGAFDVKAPKATAEDQVRYMVEVLEKAYEGRALLKDALPKLAGCTAGVGGYIDTVAAMEAVRDNRDELRRALDAMPVDKIPEGKLLLADLTEAIELSHQANVEYVAWAQAANANGCASLSASGKAAADASDAPKDRFAARWNSVIAPKFKVRTFDAWFI